MRIGIVTNCIDEEHPSYTVYTHNLVKGLNVLDKDNEYFLVHHTKSDLDVYSFNKDTLIPLPSFKPASGLIWRYFSLKNGLRKLDLDIAHDPRGVGVFAFDQPCKKVVTIHDLSSMAFPSINPGGFLAHRLFGKRTVEKCEKIITVSEFTKSEVIKYLKCPADKIEVIYNGKDDKFKVLGQKEIAGLRKKYNLDFPFILFVGVLQPRKNVPALIKAYASLKKRGIKHKLVIAGGKGWKYDDIFKTVKDLELQKDVIFTGSIPKDDLPILYNAADVFVFPSVYEGFGIPPLEAMACGVPVITSKTTSLPEVVGDAGLLIDPQDISALADAIYRVLDDSDQRSDMIKKGLERAKRFSWERCAKETLSVYRSI
jgi:glycosyltransferase involved in cell wall biosynthesis